MRLICKSCGQLLDENEFNMWLPAIQVRKDICKKCEKRQQTEWMIKELQKQEGKKKKRPGV